MKETDQNKEGKLVILLYIKMKAFVKFTQYTTVCAAMLPCRYTGYFRSFLALKRKQNQVGALSSNIYFIKESHHSVPTQEQNTIFIKV